MKILVWGKNYFFLKIPESPEDPITAAVRKYFWGKLIPGVAPHRWKNSY